MTTPHRSSPLACPRCGEIALSEQAGHWVCDACDGTLISPSELAASIHEIDGDDAAIETRELQSANASCPQCGASMQTCALVLGTSAVGGGFLRCERDGIWMPREALVAIYAAAGQRARAEHAKEGRPYGSVMSSSLQGSSGFSRMGHAGPPPGAGMVAVVQPNSNPFSHGGELAISHWESSRPSVHTVFVSAFRGYRPTCSACSGRPLAFEGDHWVCVGCRGSFVEDAALVAMISEMIAKPWELPPAIGAPGARKCPICATHMTGERIEEVAVGRCAAHGVWFDERELATALVHAAAVQTAAERSGGWLHRLFHPSGG